MKTNRSGLPTYSQAKKIAAAEYISEYGKRPYCGYFNMGRDRLGRTYLELRSRGVGVEVFCQPEKPRY